MCFPIEKFIKICKYIICAQNFAYSFFKVNKTNFHPNLKLEKIHHLIITYYVFFFISIRNIFGIHLLGGYIYI